MHNPLDLTILLQMPYGNTSQRAVDFQSLNKDGLGDESEGGDLLEDTVVQSLVKSNSVLSLVLDLSLGPLLLLCGFATARRCGSCLSFGLDERTEGRDHILATLCLCYPSPVRPIQRIATLPSSPTTNNSSPGRLHSATGAESGVKTVLTIVLQALSMWSLVFRLDPSSGARMLTKPWKRSRRSICHVTPDQWETRLRG